MVKKVLYGLYLSTSYSEDTISVNGVSLYMCVCASFDESLLNHYRDVLNEASKIRRDIMSQCFIESYNVLPVTLL